MTVPALTACIACATVGAAHAEDLTIGTGPIIFAEPATRDLLTPGASIEARFGFGFGRWLAFEVAYAGSLYRVSEPVPASLVGIGVEAEVRVGAGAPYLVAGLGSTRYHVTDPRAQTLMSNDTYVGYVPVGIGARHRVGRVILDLRATYRFATDASLIARGRGHHALDTSNLTFGIGFEL